MDVLFSILICFFQYIFSFFRQTVKRRSENGHTDGCHIRCREADTNQLPKSMPDFESCGAAYVTGAFPAAPPSRFFGP